MKISSMPISKIKELVKHHELLTDELLLEIKNDARVGVQKIYTKIQNKHKKNDELASQLSTMLEYEKDLKSQGYKCIIGIDEAGRGPLAGPVMAGAVVLPDSIDILGINDSKQLTAKKREELADKIKETALYWGLGMATPREIDKHNVHIATELAMARAIHNSNTKPDAILTDRQKVRDIPVHQVNLVRGDTKSVSIAAASILAKVERDKLMVEYDEQYPEYGFKQHKGYGTAKHLEALRKHGPSPIHRSSYKPVKEVL